jgi:hypothetical protein
MRHLTLTGYQAGQTLCGAERNGKEVHASYAPLDNEEFRAATCPACLKEYAMSFEEDEIASAPGWVKEILSAQGK